MLLSFLSFFLFSHTQKKKPSCSRTGFLLYSEVFKTGVVKTVEPWRNLQAETVSCCYNLTKAAGFISRFLQLTCSAWGGWKKPEYHSNHFSHYNSNDCLWKFKKNNCPSSASYTQPVLLCSQLGVTLVSKLWYLTLQMIRLITLKMESRL